MNIVIVGGGTAGWLSALSLSKNHKITIIDSSIPTVGVGESTTDRLVEWLLRQGIDLQEYIKEVNGAIKLATYHVNFSKKEYCHPFNIRDDQEFLDVSTWAYTNNQPVAPLSNFYNLIVNKQIPNSLEGVAIHWQAGLVPQYLEKLLNNKITIIKQQVSNVKRNGNNIKSIVLDNGQEITADYFIDCTGFHKVLVGNDDFESWNDKGVVDSAVVWNEPFKEFCPYTILEAKEYGWCWTIHTKDRAGRGYVFDSSYINPDQARQEVGVPDARTIKFDVGVQKNIMKGNIVAIGLSAHFVEPMEATNIEFTITELDLLDKVFASSMTVDEFNAELYKSAHEIRTFLKLHYIDNPNSNTEFWTNQKNAKWFDKTYQKLIVENDFDNIKQNKWQWYDVFSWLCIVQGLDIKPKYRIDDPALLAKYQLALI